jgi:hypothetical protein
MDIAELQTLYQQTIQRPEPGAGTSDFAVTARGTDSSNQITTLEELQAWLTTEPQ